MRFWDSSAIVPLLVSEASTTAVRLEFERDPDIAAWWATGVECASALSRLERAHELDPAEVTAALERLRAMSAAWHEVQPVPRARQAALRVLRLHDLQAADAMQLAAALVASEDEPASLAVVTLDGRLARAAEREGFAVIQPDHTPIRHVT